MTQQDMTRTLKIGTRGSPLALTQTKMVQSALAEHHPDLETEIVIIKTSGDWSPEQGETRLKDEDGGKGQFAKEIEEALLKQEIDCAVHSMKDMETTLPDGLVIKHMLPREDPRDALLINPLTNFDQNIESFEDGLIFGTASVRRQAFLLAKNPSLNITPLRGNVQTRIDKLKAGQVQATILAYAGLKRLGLEGEAHTILDTDTMLPAAGQGAVGIETRDADQDISDLFDPINCRSTLLCVRAERAVLDVLDGSCHTPIGAHALLNGERLFLRACLASLDGQQLFEEEINAQVTDVQTAEKVGSELGQKLKDQAPAGLLNQKIEAA